MSRSRSSSAASVATTLQIRPCLFNNFQDAPPATPFLLCICMVAGGWVYPIPSGVKVSLELSIRRGTSHPERRISR